MASSPTGTSTEIGKRNAYAEPEPIAEPAASTSPSPSPSPSPSQRLHHRVGCPSQRPSQRPSPSLRLNHRVGCPSQRPSQRPSPSLRVHCPIGEHRQRAHRRAHRGDHHQSPVMHQPVAEPLASHRQPTSMSQKTISQHVSHGVKDSACWKSRPAKSGTGSTSLTL